MDSPSSVALSGQQARERQMDVLANNLANVSTTAFKGLRMLFAEYLSTQGGGSPVSYVQDIGTVRDWSQGPLTQTGNPLDVALQGTGFLEIQTAQGVRYTRDGRLKIDAQGQLVTLDDNPVLNPTQQPIVIPPNSASLTIGQDGTIGARAGTLGRLAVVSFDDLQGLAAEQDGLYDSDETPTPSTDTKVAQGMVEESNVQPITEMTRLMAVSHSVSMDKTFQDNEAERRKSSIDRLAKVV